MYFTMSSTLDTIEPAGPTWSMIRIGTFTTAPFRFS